MRHFDSGDPTQMRLAPVASPVEVVTVPENPRDITVNLMGPIVLNRASGKARQLVPFTLVQLDLGAGHLRYVNAGGPAPLLLVGPGRLVTLDQISLLIGIDSHYDYESASVDLPSAFRLICHSDGLVEMANAAGEPFGSQRLHDLLLEPALFAPPDEMIRRIVDAAARHRRDHPADDDALVAVVGHG